MKLRTGWLAETTYHREIQYGGINQADKSWWVRKSYEVVLLFLSPWLRPDVESGLKAEFDTIVLITISSVREKYRSPAGW